MQLKIGRWLHKNGIYLQLLGVASGAIGLLLSGISLFSPVIFLTLAHFVPFLASLNFPLALLTVGIIGSGGLFVGALVGFLLAKQIISIGQHVLALFCNEHTPSYQDSTHYIHKHLRGKSDDSLPGYCLNQEQPTAAKSMANSGNKEEIFSSEPALTPDENDDYKIHMRL